MCGRFSLTTNLTQIAAHFDVHTGDIQWSPRYNIAPTQQVLTIVPGNQQPSLRLMRWGLIPFFSHDGSKSFINARAESAAEKPSFKNAYAKRHCAILADGFYEWEQTPQGKMPWRATFKDRKPFAMAGIYEPFNDGSGEPLMTCSILTVPANPLLSKLHERMPAVLTPEMLPDWLACHSDVSTFPDRDMELYRVSQLVNTWKIDDASCIEPLRLS